MKNLIDQHAQGAAVLEKFAQLNDLPAELKPHLDAFGKAHQALEEAARACDEARMARDAALSVAAVADDALDVAVEKLASAVVGAGLGKRTAPFAGLSHFSPANLTRLAYLTEVKEVRVLVAKVAAKGPPQEVTKVIAECLQQAAAVEAGLGKLSGPQADYDRKRAARDEAAMAWSKAYGKLQLRAQVAFEDAPATFQSLFAGPEAVQRPVKHLKKKASVTTTKDVPA